MKAHTLLTKAAAGLGAAAVVLALGACSHSNTLASEQSSGQIRTEQAAQQQATSGETVAVAPAPANTQGASNPGTPAIISGPAAVDNTGRVYTSSSVGSAGNASSTGLNTNVNIIPKSTAGTVTVAETPAPVVEAPPPAPVVVETPAPPPPVVETPAPMVSSTTTTTHVRLRKD